MSLFEIEFLSQNNRDTVYGWIYAPAKQPRAVVQIIHGLGEHSRRYLHLINILLDQGVVVVADDHVGHGKTAAVSGKWVDSGPNGAVTAVADELTLMRLAQERYPDLPYFVYGHSWGSMIARGVAQECSTELSGLILGGIAAQIKGIEEVFDREALAAEPDGSAIASPTYGATLFAGANDRWPEDPMPTAWVARNADVVRDHSVDPFNNFGAPMTVDFLRGLVEVYDQANTDDWYVVVDSKLPVLILAGDQDPIGNYGEGAYHVANKLVDSGNADVRTRVYSGFRHEVHNEPEIRDDVENEIVTFVEAHS